VGWQPAWACFTSCAGPESSIAEATLAFDGQRLRVPVLAAAFDPTAERWTGTWSFDGQMRDVVLERPHPVKGVTPNPLCGDWEGLPDAPSGPTTVRLHVLQSSDGTFTAWMDVLSVVQDQSYGLSLKVIDADPPNVILQNESPTFSFYGQFSGDLSSSHRVGRSRRSRKGGSVAHVRAIHGCYTIAAEQEALCAYASSARF
jgi:hypothetical protein